jgi:hypothetical protein
MAIPRYLQMSDYTIFINDCSHHILAGIAGYGTDVAIQTLSNQGASQTAMNGIGNGLLQVSSP